MNNVKREQIEQCKNQFIKYLNMHFFQPLLPKHLYRAVNYSPHYVDSASCNILGLHPLVNIPQSAMSLDSLCVIDLVPKEEILNDSCKSVPKSSSSIYDTATGGYEAIKVEQKMNIQNIEENIKNFSVRVSHLI